MLRRIGRWLSRALKYGRRRRKGRLRSRKGRKRGALFRRCVLRRFYCVSLRSGIEVLGLTWAPFSWA